MATGDKIFVTLLALFIAGLVGGIFGSVQWLWLCAPLAIVVALVAWAFWLANRQLKGWKIL
jgi:hypothetical protein